METIFDFSFLEKKDFIFTNLAQRAYVASGEHRGKSGIITAISLPNEVKIRLSKTESVWQNREEVEEFTAQAETEKLEKYAADAEEK